MTFYNSIVIVAFRVFRILLISNFLLIKMIVFVTDFIFVINYNLSFLLFKPPRERAYMVTFHFLIFG